MLFLVLFFIILIKFTRSKLNSSTTKIFYFSGLFLIIVNVFWVHAISGHYFAGSDASAYYDQAKLFVELKSILVFIDIRYVGYTIYQVVAAYPYLENPMMASIFIKLANWSFFYLSVLSIIKNVNSYFQVYIPAQKFIFTSVVFMGLWLSFYNFRDIIITSLLLFIFSYYISSNKKWLIITLFVLFYFRFLYVIMLILAYFITNIIKSRDVYKTKILGTFNAFNIIVIAVFLVSLSNVNFVTTLGQYSNNLVNNNQHEVIFDNSNGINSIVKGLFSGNTINFLVEYYFHNYSRAYTITPITALFMSMIYLYSYVYFIIFILFTLTSNNIFNKLKGQDVLISYLIISTFFIIFSIVIYSLYFGSIQERIRVPFLLLIAINTSILMAKNSLKLNFKRYINIILFLTLTIYIFFYLNR